MIFSALTWIQKLEKFLVLISTVQLHNPLSTMRTYILEKDLLRCLVQSYALPCKSFCNSVNRFRKKEPGTSVYSGYVQLVSSKLIYDRDARSNYEAIMIRRLFMLNYVTLKFKV